MLSSHLGEEEIITSWLMHHFLQNYSNFLRYDFAITMQLL